MVKTTQKIVLGLLISVLLGSIMLVISSTSIVSRTETFHTEGNETTPKYGGTLRIGHDSPVKILAIARTAVFNGLTRLNETLQVVSARVIPTPKIIVTLTDDIEKSLRDTARTKYGNKRGALSIIVEEALKKYLAEEK